MYIVVSQAGTPAVAVKASELENEAKLQEFLDHNLHSLPWSEIDPDIKLFQFGREFRTRAGKGERTDLLAIDAVGNFYIIETKLERNADKRTVIAQALDYGASLWTRYLDAANLIDDLDARFGFRSGAQQRFGFNEQEMVDLLDQFQSNVQAGRIRFVVVMDVVDEALKDLVRFINRNSNFNVYLVDLQFFRHQGIEVVVPTMHGVEAAKVAGKASGSRAVLSLEEFMSSIPSDLSPTDREMIADVAELTVSVANHRPSPSALYGRSAPPDLVHLYRIDPSGQIRLRLPGPGSKPSELSVHEKWQRALNAAGFAIPAGYQDGGKGWSRKLSEWKPHAPKLLAAIREFGSTA